jgi:hypothetical protein
VSPVELQLWERRGRGAALPARDAERVERDVREQDGGAGGDERGALGLAGGDEDPVIILGVLLLLIGLFTTLKILITIGVILVVIGVVLLLLGTARTGGRRWY